METDHVFRGSGHHSSSRVVADPAICGGRPTIRGTRMRIADILDMMASGETRGTILTDFEHLTDDDITAALTSAARSIDHRVIQAAWRCVF